MGKSIAIIVGVSEYDKLESLPPCDNDTKIINAIISSTDKFEVLKISSSPKGSVAVKEITSFIRGKEGQEIDEVFFYYSGHGMRRKDDFLYLFSDFSNDEISQTTISNTEIDKMIKSLNPELTIKVIDACQSGTEYIKSNEDLEMIFNKSSKSNFKKTYFLFSSGSNQSSIAERDYSVFTKSFAKAVIKYSPGEILYRNIAAYIADDVEVKKHQTPLFIQQASNTEMFFDSSEEIKEKIQGLIDDMDGEETIIQEVLDDYPAGNDELSKEEKIINAIKKKSESYCNEKEAITSLNNLLKFIKEYEWKNPLEDLYYVEIEAKEFYEDITSMESISKWLIDNDGYFAKPTFTSKSYKDFKRVGIYLSEYKEVTEYRDVPNSIHLTANSPYDSITLKFNPKEEALLWYKASIIQIFSKVKLTLFYKIEVQKEVNWDSQKPIVNTEWQILHCKLKDHDAIKSNVQKILDEFKDHLIEEITDGIDLG